MVSTLLKGKKMKFRNLILSSLIVVTSIACGANIEVGVVGADAAWHSHFDIEKFNNSKLRAMADSRGLADKCAKVEQYLGLDPLEDIKSVTLYGSSYDPDDAAAVLKGDFDIKKLNNMVKKQPEYTTVSYGDYQIAGWQGRKGVKKAGCFYDASTLVMARNINNVISAIDILNGNSPAIPESLCTTSDDAVFQVFIQDASSMAQKEPHLTFLNNVGQTLFALGQKNDDLFCEIIMQADTPENARLLTQMVEGMVAMGKMKAAEKNNDLAAGALNNVFVSSAENTVITTMVLTTAQFEEMVKAIEANKNVISKIYDEMPSDGQI
jgi:hypothetical protein